MQAIEVIHNNKRYNISAEDVVVININDIVDKDAFISICCRTQKEKIWNEFMPIHIGDKFEKGLAATTLLSRHKELKQLVLFIIDINEKVENINLSILDRI